MVNIETIVFEKKKSAIQNILYLANQSEYYYSVFRNAHIDINRIESYGDFSKIPILEKKTYAQNKYSMIVDSVRREDIKKRLSCATNLRDRRRICEEYGFFLKITSGSTGYPLEVLKDKKDLLREYIGLNCARVKVRGSMPTGRYVWIWPANKKIRDYFYEDQNVSIYKENEYGYKYMMPEYSSVSFDRLYLFLVEKCISWITAPASMLCLFAKYVESNNLKMNFTYIECHSEKLYDWQSIYIEKVFGCQPLNVYSSNEVQFMGITNYEQKMHVISQNVFLELIPDEDGKKTVVATSLCAKEIPIIRYCLGDVANWEEVQEHEKKLCDPNIIINGYRCNDYIILNNGKKFEPFILFDLMILLNDRFSLGIKEYMVQQVEYDKFVFFLSSDIVKSINNDLAINQYVLNYLQNVLDIIVKTDYIDIKTIRKKIGTQKYKYFLSMANE